MSLEFALLDASGEEIDAAQDFEREFSAGLRQFVVTEGEFPDTLEFDAAVVTGSDASVYHDDEWISTLKEWVLEAVHEGVPVLGVCFGHQLLADVLGGTVEGRERYETGFHDVEHSQENPLFDDVPRVFKAFLSHSDDVVALPLGACKHAHNEHSLQAFRKGRAFGVQFHPEVDMETAEFLAEKREPSNERTPDGRATVVESNYEEAKKAKRIFSNFEDYVRSIDDEGVASEASADMSTLN